jgi:predicted nucleotidyltransferase
VYRVLLTGIHLMQTGVVEANLLRLNERFRLPYLPELIARKLAGPEHGTLPDADLEFYHNEYLRLRAALEDAHRTSSLPEAPSGRAALNEFLIRVRTTGG